MVAPGHTYIVFDGSRCGMLVVVFKDATIVHFVLDY